MNKWIAFTGIGFELIGLIVGSLYAANYLESRWPIKGLWVAILVLLALAMWFVHVLFLLKKMQDSDSSD